MPKILQVLPKLHRGELEIGTLQIAKALVQKGWECVIASNFGALESEIRHTPIHHLHLPLDTKNPLRIVYHAWVIKRYLQKESINLIHIRSRAPGWSAYLASKWTQIPIVSTIHGMYTSNNFIKRWYNSVMIRPQHIIAISQQGKEYVLHQYKKYLEPSQKIHVIYRGIPEFFFQPPPSPESRKRLYQKLNIPLNAYTFLICGRWSEQKGQHIAIQALKILDRRDVHLICVGSTQAHPEFVQHWLAFGRKHNLHTNIHSLGICEDMIPIYDAVNAVLFPITRSEPFGRILVEAQARHKIVIGSWIGATQEVVCPALHDFCPHPNNPSHLALAMQQVCDLSASQISTYTTRAFDFVHQHFTESQMTQKTLDLYEQILYTERIRVNRKKRL